VVPIKGGIVVAKVVAKRDGQPLKDFGATFIQYKLFIPSDSDWTRFQGGELRYETDEPGTWQVDVSAEGLASHRTEKFSLGAGEVKDLGTIRLGPGGTIAGRVIDAQQRPVPYARINILNDKLQTNDDEPFTDFDGRFEVKGVSPGLFTVFAVSPRHPLGMVRGVDVREGERTEVQIAFVDSAPLTIDVRDSSGQPVEGAALDFTFPAVAPLTSKLFRGKIPPGYGSHKSDATGTILQPCLPPGEVTITIEMKGFESVTKKLDLKPGEPNRVEIRLRRMGG
jgi:predicted DNA-binding antitoxin AbrB/MazE fold protein